MIGATRATVRNAGFLVLQRGFHVLVGLLFAILIPRVMGPAAFGRFALLGFRSPSDDRRLHAAREPTCCIEIRSTV
jgi:hypothetical protein